MGSLRYSRPHVVATVDGLAVPTLLEAHTSHGVDQPVATCSIVVPLPRPAHVVVGGVLEVIATAPDDEGVIQTGRIFHGVIRDTGAEFVPGQKTATLKADGWGYLLSFPGVEDISWTGPITAKNIIRGIMARWGINARGSWQLDEIVTPAPTSLVMLGGNPDVDGGQIILKAGTSPLEFIRSILEPFGYRAFDTPVGMFRVRRVSGVPNEPAAVTGATFDETAHGFQWRRTNDVRPVVNYVEVLGASGTAADGSEFALRSFPAVVPASPYIPAKPGVKQMTISNNLLVDQELCDAVRNVAEEDYGAPSVHLEWSESGQPKLSPGRIVELIAPTVEQASGQVWLMGLDQDWGPDGFSATMRGWTGGGVALPGGEDVCVSETLAAGPLHIGDETVPWYAVPAPNGTTVTVNFTPLDDYDSISITGLAHGANSQMLDGSGNTDLQVSKFIVEQPSGTEIGSGTMPVLDENYAQQIDYTNIANWTPFDVPVPGNLAGGQAAVLKLIAGDNGAAGIDDYEVRDLVLTSCAQGQPVLPGPATPVVTPPPQPSLGNCVIVSSAGSSGPSGNTGLSCAAFTVPQGSTWLRATADFTGLLATSSIFGPESSEIWRWPLNSVVNRLYLPGTQPGPGIEAGTVQAGGGLREYTWNVTGICGPADLVIAQGDIYVQNLSSTTNTITFTHWQMCWGST